MRGEERQLPHFFHLCLTLTTFFSCQTLLCGTFCQLGVFCSKESAQGQRHPFSEVKDQPLYITIQNAFNCSETFDLIRFQHSVHQLFLPFFFSFTKSGHAVETLYLSTSPAMGSLFKHFTLSHVFQPLSCPVLSFC